MGNRAVIVSADTTKENYKQKLGIYLHWYGSEDTVEFFLSKAKEANIRGVIGDYQYGWARLCQIIGMEIDKCEHHPDTVGECGMGIGIVRRLDCHNYDNGVYYIDNQFNIVNHTSGEELEPTAEEIKAEKRGK